MVVSAFLLSFYHTFWYNSVIVEKTQRDFNTNTLKEEKIMKKNLKQLSALLLALSLSVSVTACGGNTATTATTTAETTAGAATEAASESAPETSAAAEANLTVEYPVTVTDHLGREVTIEKQPESFVSGYYISTSLMIALDLDEQLVGVEAKADKRKIYKLSAPKLTELPSVGTAKEFDLEGCAALKPDLVIVPTKLKDSIPAMEELGLTVIAVNPEDQTKLFETIDMISTAANVVEKGQKLESWISDSLSGLKDSLDGAKTPSVYLAGNSALLQTAGPEMYQSTLIENAGGVNAASDITDTYWADTSYEQILSWNPDYIILAADADYDVDSVLKDSALADCTAVKEGHVAQIPSDIEALDSPVPASFLGSYYVASILHPEVVTEEDFAAAEKDFYETFYGFTPESAD